MTVRLKQPISILLGLAGVLALLLPTLVALKLASRQGLQTQMDHASALASEVLRRSENISAQLDKSFAALESLHAGAPCSPASIQSMRQLTLKMYLLSDIGYLRNNILECSSAGPLVIDMGPPDYVSATGFEIRRRDKLMPDTQLLLTTRRPSGFTGIINEAMPLDIAPEKSFEHYGLIGWTRRRVLMEHGTISPWLPLIGPETKQVKYDGRNIIAWTKSARYDYAGLAIIPQRDVDASFMAAAMIIVPIGVISGLLFLFAVTYVARQQGSLPSMFRTALRKNEILLHYQPIVDLNSRRWVGVEALVRWRRSNGEWIPPNTFVPVLEQFQLTSRLTQRVLELVEKDAAKLFKGRPDFFVSVNFASGDFVSPAITQQLLALKSRCKLAAHNLRIEATERVFLHAEESLEHVTQLRELGFHIAIDDFGTGYSGLSYLTRFGFKGLKIDKSFVDTIGTDAVTSQVITHIIALAKSLDMCMVAEGIEMQAQADYLREQGVQYGQGWLFSKALPLNELLRALAAP